MIPLLILATVFLACWLWATWRRDGAAASMREWSYALLVAAITCYLMAIGLWIRLG